MKTYKGDRLSDYINEEKKKKLALIKMWRENRLVKNLFINIIVPLLFVVFLAYVFP